MTFLKRVEFKIKAAFFALFQFAFKKAGRYTLPLDGNNFRKILFLRPDRIGDTVCSFPLIDHLKKTYPGMKMSIYASTKNYGLIKNDPRFENIYIYRRNIIKDILQVIKIRREKYDLLIDMMGDDSVTTLFLSQFTVADAPRLGVNKSKYRRYYDYTFLQPEDCTEHTIDINLELFNAFGIKPSEAEGFAPPYVSPESEKTVERFLKDLQDKRRMEQTIGVNLSARGVNRDWGDDNWERLLRQITENHREIQVILISVPSERKRGNDLQEKLNGKVQQIFPNANLTEVSSLLKRLDLLISPDTSLVHIARSFQVKVIGLYPEYRKVFRQWLPYRFPEGLVLSYGGDDIFNIEVSEVYDRFRKLLLGAGTAESGSIRG